MSRKLKLLAVLNVVGWAIVAPVLVGALLHPFIDFSGWPGSTLLSRPPQDAPLADLPRASQPAARAPRRRRAPARAARAARRGAILAGGNGVPAAVSACPPPGGMPAGAVGSGGAASGRRGRCPGTSPASWSAATGSSAPATVPGRRRLPGSAADARGAATIPVPATPGVPTVSVPVTSFPALPVVAILASPPAARPSSLVPTTTRSTPTPTHDDDADRRPVARSGELRPRCPWPSDPADGATGARDAAGRAARDHARRRPRSRRS